MEEPGISLEDLSAATGVEPRTLRSWVAEGLLAPPLRGGRGATYPHNNLDRALAIRALKDLHGLTLAKIGRMFLTASDQQIRDWAKDAGALPGSPGSARDYVRALRSREARSPARLQDLSESPAAVTFNYRRALLLPDEPAFPEEKPADLGRIERLVALLQTLLAAPAPRRAQGTTWTRIDITPDLEIAVRGELDPAERHLFLQLADQLRALLTERTQP